MRITALGNDRDIYYPFRLNSYPRAMNGVLHSVSEKDKDKTSCGKLILEMHFVSGEFVRHENKCCKICKP